jgi:hypothetical protein
VSWEEAVICSCWNLDSGQPAYACQACYGKGYVYQQSIEGIVLVTSISMNKEFQEMAGIFEVGDAVMTVPRRTPLKLSDGSWSMSDFQDNPLFEIGMYDKITLLDDEYKTSEILVKDTPMYGRPADTLINSKITKIKAIKQFNSETGGTVDYTIDTDFTLSDNKIAWIEGQPQPVSGSQYSVTYFHRPTYIVSANLPKPRHQDNQELPRYVALKYLNGGIEHK